MQNLLLKLVVLSGVIGGSGFVVWRAHDGLQQVAENSATDSFTPLESETGFAPPPSAIPQEAPLADQLMSISPKSVAMADAPPAPPEVGPFSLDSLAFPHPAANKPAEPKKETPKPVPRDFPLVFGELDPAPVRTAEAVKPLPAAPASAVDPADPFQPLPEPPQAPAPAQVELTAAAPPQQEEPSAEQAPLLLPQPQALPEMAAMIPPAQLEPPEQEEPEPEEVAPQPTPARSFGPSHRTTAAMDDPFAAQTPAPTQSEDAPPGLTRMPDAAPTPVLLPVEPRPYSWDDTPRRAGPVVTADAVEVDEPQIEQANGNAPFIPLVHPAKPPEVKGPEPEEILPTPPKTPLPSLGGDDPFGMTISPQPKSQPQPPPQVEPRPIEKAPPVEARPFLPFALEKPAEPTPTPAPTPVEMPEAPAPAGPPATTPGGFPGYPGLPVQAETSDELLPTPAAEAPAPKAIPAEKSPWSQEPVPVPKPAAPPQSEDPFSGSPLPTIVPQPPRSPALPEPSPILLPSEAPQMTPQAPPEQASIPLPTLPTTPEVEPISTVQPPYHSAAPSQLLGNAEVSPNIPSGPQTPELKIEKIAPREATIGEPVVYAIVIRNAGGSTARDVKVEDQIPRGARLEGTIPQAVLTNGKLLWELGTIEPGSERKIQLKVTPLEPGQIGSVATVSFGAVVSASIRVTAPKLTIDMQGPSEGLVGEKLSYRFTLKNSGEGAAKSVFLRAVLPAGMKHPGGNDIEYEVGTLPPGGERAIELVVLAEKSGVFTPRGMVTNDGKTIEEKRADVRVIDSRLRVDRTGPARRFVNRPATFQTVVTNESAQVLKDVVVRESLPQSVELAGIPVGGHFDAVRRTITWRVPQLAPGESQQFESKLVAALAGAHEGTVVAQDASGNRAEVKSALEVKGFADLVLDVSSPHRTVVVGEQVSVRAVLRNDGSAPAGNVRTTFEIPPGLQFAAANGPVSYEVEGSQVRFAPLEQVPMQGQQTFDLVLTAIGQGSTKVTLQLESTDFDTLRRDHAIRVLAE